MKLRIYLIAVALVFSVSAKAQTYAVDWSITGLSYDGDTYTDLRLDFEFLKRFFDVNGTLSTGIFFRPVDGTCVLEVTNDVVCELRLDALTLSLRLNSDTLDGSIALIDTSSTRQLDSGLIRLSAFN